MRVARDLSPATVGRLRAHQGSESAPSPEGHPEREALIDEGIALLSRRYGRAVGSEEARRMIERLTAFFDLLSEWQDRAQAGPGEGEVAA